MSDKAWNRRSWLALAGACLLLIAQFAVLIHTRWVEDESWLSSEAWARATEGTSRMMLMPSDPRFIVSGSMPVYPNSLAASFKIFGLGMVQARAVSLLGALGVLVVLFLLARQIGGPRCAIATALIAATDTFLVIAARTTRAEAIVTLLSWLALLLVWHAIERGSKGYALAAGAAAGAALMCHPLAVPFVLAIGAFFLMQYRWTVWKQPVVWIVCLTAAIPVVWFLWWSYSDAAHIAAFRSGVTAKATEPLIEHIKAEGDRWQDFLGMASQRVHVPLRIPVRLHVCVILAGALMFLARSHRRAGIAAGTILAITLVWFFYMPNKSPRYLVELSPLFCLALGYLAAFSGKLRARKLVLAAVALVVLTQCAANAYWLYRYRAADYPAVAAELRKIIPPKASVYGITTFWLALHDRTYYAYDRTKLEYAVEKLHPEYMILHDRVMEHGSGHGEDDFAELRAKATEFARQHGVLAGRVANDFYGDLEIWRVTY